MPRYVRRRGVRQETFYDLRGRPITTHAVLLWHRKGRGVPRHMSSASFGKMGLFSACLGLIGDGRYLPAAGQNRLQLQEGRINTLIHVVSLRDFCLGCFKV